MMQWVRSLTDIPGTIVSASSETIHNHPFEGMLPNLTLVTSFRHGWIDLWRQAGFRVFCLEEAIPIMSSTTTSLLSHPLTLKYLTSLKKPVRILVFKPSSILEKTLQKHDFQLLNSPSQISRMMENKLKFSMFAKEAGIPTVSSMNIHLSKDLHFKQLQDQLGPVIICQFAKGFSGNRTYRIETPGNLESLIEAFPGRLCKFSKFEEGFTWTANGCVFPEGKIFIPSPFFQISLERPGRNNLPPTTGSIGNLWTLPSESVSQMIKNIMYSMGKVLFRRGFRGVFGMDFLDSRDTSTVKAIEVNPRLVASLPALTPLEISLKQEPTIARHIEAVSGIHQQTPDSEIQTLPAGGQLIIRKDNPVFSKYVCRFTSGYYKVANERLVFESPGWSPGRISHHRWLVWRSSEASEFNEQARLFFLLPNLKHARDIQLYILGILERSV